LNSPAAQATIERFYAAFARLDGGGMAACYTADAAFDDPAFSLRGRDQVGGMWQMLCDSTRAKGMAHWRLEVSDIATDAGTSTSTSTSKGTSTSTSASTGRAHWEAHYLFPSTGRLVHNRIDASFVFGAQGLIARHTDRFDFAAWSRQALGATGWLLGWTPWLRAQVRRQAAAQLQRYLARR